MPPRRRISQRDLSSKKIQLPKRIYKESQAAQCPDCSKKFRCKADMRAHRRMHTNERIYVCKVLNCGKSFIWRSSLRYHKTTHTRFNGQKNRNKYETVSAKSKAENSLNEPVSCSPNPEAQNFRSPDLQEVHSISPDDLDNDAVAEAAMWDPSQGDPSVQVLWFPDHEDQGVQVASPLLNLNGAGSRLEATIRPRNRLEVLTGVPSGGETAENQGMSSARTMKDTEWKREPKHDFYRELDRILGLGRPGGLPEDISHWDPLSPSEF